MLRLSAVGVAVGAEGDTKEISVATYPKGEDWDVSQNEDQTWFSCRKSDNKFRRFRMIYSIPTDTITIKKMEDGDF